MGWEESGSSSILPGGPDRDPVSCPGVQPSRACFARKTLLISRVLPRPQASAREAWEMREGSRPRAPNLAALQSTGQRRRPACTLGWGPVCFSRCPGGGPSPAPAEDEPGVPAGALPHSSAGSSLSPGEAGSHREEEAAGPYPPPQGLSPRSGDRRGPSGHPQRGASVFKWAGNPAMGHWGAVGA